MNLKKRDCDEKLMYAHYLVDLTIKIELMLYFMSLHVSLLDVSPRQAYCLEINVHVFLYAHSLKNYANQFPQHNVDTFEGGNENDLYFSSTITGRLLLYDNSLPILGSKLQLHNDQLVTKANS